MSIKRKLLGQLPTVVDKDETEEDVDIVEEKSDQNISKQLKKNLHRNVTEDEIDDKYFDLKQSEFSKTVVRSTKRNIENFKS